MFYETFQMSASYQENESFELARVTMYRALTIVDISLSHERKPKLYWGSNDLQKPKSILHENFPFNLTMERTWKYKTKWMTLILVLLLVSPLVSGCSLLSLSQKYKDWELWAKLNRTNRRAKISILWAPVEAKNSSCIKLISL